MKTGIELIAEERQEQIEKHGFDVNNDQYYSKGELLQAALFCLYPKIYKWPDGWNEHFRDKILNKSRVDQLKCCGAFAAAEIDRLQSYFVVKEDSICPVTKELCDDECCPIGSICNLKGRFHDGHSNIDWRKRAKHFEEEFNAANKEIIYLRSQYEPKFIKDKIKLDLWEEIRCEFMMNNNALQHLEEHFTIARKPPKT